MTRCVGHLDVDTLLSKVLLSPPWALHSKLVHSHTVCKLASPSFAKLIMCLQMSLLKPYMSYGEAQNLHALWLVARMMCLRLKA